MTTRAKDGIIKKKKSFLSTKHPLPKGLIATLESLEPTSYTQANKLAEWLHAMDHEFSTLQRCGTWSLVPYKPHMNIVGCKWVYQIKKNSDGSIQRYKACLVAKGFHQQPGIDFFETFSPVVKQATIRVVLSIAIHFDWEIQQPDVESAFLHGELYEEVYMAQPQGYVDPMYPTHVCHMHKSIYGLRQAPRAWFEKFTSKLLERGFVGSYADTSLFIRSDEGSITSLLIYVDDIILTRNNNKILRRLIYHLGRHFAMKDLGPSVIF